MIQSLYSGATGLNTVQRSIDTIANNVANIGTDGYKKVRTDFKDALYQRLRNPAGDQPMVNLERGVGSLMYQNLRVFHVGTMQHTGRSLDVMLEQEGFFEVENPRAAEEGQPPVFYTRAGHMETKPDRFLVSEQGYYVLDDTGSRIALPENVSLDDIVFGTDGSISYKDNGVEVPLDVRLGMYNFTNPPGLAAEGNNLYAATENSGESWALADGLVQGYTEASNVDYGEEVTRLIRAQRAYQLISRCITTADQMEGLCNTIRS